VAISGYIIVQLLQKFSPVPPREKNIVPPASAEKNLAYVLAHVGRLVWSELLFVGLFFSKKPF
jgi:hypothetical protein